MDYAKMRGDYIYIYEQIVGHIVNERFDWNFSI